MTEDEITKKQKETLNNIKKYNDSRNTEIVNDTEGNPTAVTQYIDEPEVVDAPEPEEKMIMSHICPYCGTMAYIGQIHGLGYCKEKVIYEQ